MTIASKEYCSEVIEKGRLLSERNCEVKFTLSDNNQEVVGSIMKITNSLNDDDDDPRTYYFELFDGGFTVIDEQPKRIVMVRDVKSIEKLS